MIITDEKLLRTPCVDATSEEVGEIIAKLELELRHSAELGHEGIGLSAPQIGIFKKVAIARVPTNHGMTSVNLVNCRIDKGYDLAIFEKEGCLSFKNLLIRTKRFKEIYVMDNLVEPHSFIATGLMAVCIQHELDHCRGVLLTDMIKI